MSFVPVIRDYIELLNNVYDSLSGDMNLQIVLQKTFFYFFEIIKNFVFYSLTFAWLRDFFYLPIVIPKISSSILKESLFFADPSSNTFQFLEPSFCTYNKFFLGFLNSFFLSLPLSCAHLIFVRRLFIQGNAAGIAAGLGNIFGQFFFITCVIFGFRDIVIPWFSSEPLTFLAGCVLLLTIVYDMSHERVIKIIDWKNRNVLLKIFLLNFALIWTEQSSIFQYLGNLTLNSEPTNLEIFSTNTQTQYFLTHVTYLLGIFIGTLFFTFLFSLALKKISEFIQIKFAILRSTWIIRLNFFFLSSIVAFTFTSIPYYGLDYILTGPLGFVSQDQSFKKTLFSQNELTDPFGVLGSLADNLSLNTDATPFDRGLYLNMPLLQTFEDLNYAGEYASTTRQGSIPLFARYKENAKKLRKEIRKTTENMGETVVNSAKNLEKAQETGKRIPNAVSKKEDPLKNEIDSSFDDLVFSPKDENRYIYSNLKKRFEDNYDKPSNSTFQRSLNDTLNSAFSQENSTFADPEVQKKIKTRYYTNPVYKFLLNIDIDSFLKRQPSNFALSPLEEKQLYKKRLLLSQYHESLRVYNKLPYQYEFQYLFGGSKSFAARVYNQQFKGTLQVVRRLFSINFQPNQNEFQPGFTGGVKPGTQSIESPSTQNIILKYDQALYKKEKNEVPLIHEELNGANLENNPFLKLTNPIPLYVGWDEGLRKLIITNRLLPRSIATFIQPTSKKTSLNWHKVPAKLPSSQVQSEFSSPFSGETKGKKNKIVQFTTWPLSKHRLNETQYFVPSRLFYVTRDDAQKDSDLQKYNLFEATMEDSEKLSYYNSLPENFLKISQTQDRIDIVPPNRGGFIWPGNSSLKFALNSPVEK